MALKYETREICGTSVSSTQFPAMKGYTLFTRLCRLAAPVIGQLTSGISASTDVGDLASALTELFAQLDESTAEDLALKLLASTQVQVTGPDGSPRWLSLTTKTAVDAAFEGSLMTMLGAMKLAIEVNFADFIASALSAARARKAAAEALKAAKMAQAESARAQA